MAWSFIRMPRGTLQEWSQALQKYPQYQRHWLCLVDSLLGDDSRCDEYSMETVERRSGCRDAAHCRRFLDALKNAGLATVTESGIRFPFVEEAWAYREAQSAKKRANANGPRRSRPAREPAATGSWAARWSLATGSGGEFLKENHNHTRATAWRPLAEEEKEEEEKEKELPPLPPSPRRADVARIAEQATTAIAPDRRSKWLGNEADGAGSADEAEALAPPPPVVPSDALRTSRLANGTYATAGARSRR